MKLKIICFLVIFTNFLFASQQEINREHSCIIKNK